MHIQRPLTHGVFKVFDTDRSVGANEGTDKSKGTWRTGQGKPEFTDGK
jgi:hypothetical protein